MAHRANLNRNTKSAQASRGAWLYAKPLNKAKRAEAETNAEHNLRSILKNTFSNLSGSEVEAMALGMITRQGTAKKALRLLSPARPVRKGME